MQHFYRMFSLLFIRRAWLNSGLFQLEPEKQNYNTELLLLNSAATGNYKN